MLIIAIDTTWVGIIDWEGMSKDITLLNFTKALAY